MFKFINQYYSEQYKERRSELVIQRRQDKCLIHQVSKEWFCIEKNCQFKEFICYNCSKNIQSKHFNHETIHAQNYLYTVAPLYFNHFIEIVYWFLYSISFLKEEEEYYCPIQIKEMEEKCEKMMKQFKKSGNYGLVQKVQNRKFNHVFTKNVYQFKDLKFLAEQNFLHSECMKKFLEKLKTERCSWFNKFEDFLKKQYKELEYYHVKKLKECNRVCHELCLLKQIQLYEEDLKYHLSMYLKSRITIKDLATIFYNQELKQLKVSFKKTEEVPRRYRVYLETLHLDYSSEINNSQLKVFFDHIYFPQLSSIILFASKKSDNTQQNLMRVLELNFERVKHFQIKDLNSPKKQVKQKILNFLENNYFHQVTLPQMNFSDEEEQRYKKIIKKKLPNIVLSRYNERINFYNEKVIVYSFAKYYKFQYLDKKIFQNIVLKLLI